MRFQVAGIVSKDWSQRVWPNVLIIVVLAAGWLGGCGGLSPQPAERCGSVQFVDGQSQEPKVVVVLIDGAPSEERGGKFYPVPVANPGNDKVVTNYCPIDPNGNERDASNSWPDGLQDGLRRWSEFDVPSDTSGGSSPPEASLVCEDHKLEIVPGGTATEINGALHNNDKKNCLVAQLADAGAVILPYSYAGATLSQQPSGPIFDFHPYDGNTTKQAPSISVQRLDDELTSIHSVWKDTHIVIVGHSFGGMIAEQWWEAIRVTHNHTRGVVHVFSLDSPINGVEHCALAALLYGSAISQKWCELWDGSNGLSGRKTRDPFLINLDTDTTFPYTAIGTPSDPTYGGLPNGGGDLEAQVLYNYNQCDPQQDKQCHPPEPPSYVLGTPNAPECVGNGAAIYGTTGHDIVKVCPQVVKFIGCSVVAARDNGNQKNCYPGAVSPTPTSAQPTQTSPSGDLTKVDWANFTYFSSCFGNQRPFKARDGQATNDFILFQVYPPPTYGDLTGDGQPEAVVSYSCTGANFGGVHVLIYTGNAAHPMLLGDLPLSDPSDKLATIDSVNISNSDLQLTGRGYSPTAASCCPDLSVNNSYHWDGSRFVLVNSTVT